MAFTLVQAGTQLYPVNTDGALGAALTLPNGIALTATRVPRFAKFKNYVVLVNTPSKPVSIDVNGTVRPLTPAPPATPLGLVATGSGNLTGNYLGEFTYVIKDAVGNDIAESDFSPIMTTAVATSAQQLTDSFTTSAEASVNARRLYRTTEGPGSVYFPLIDVPDNLTTSVADNLPDASLSLIGKPARGSAPDLTLVCEWAGRLWGVDRNDIDDLRYTEAGTMFAWNGLDTLPIPHLGEDRFGITALAPRQNQLVVGRRNNILAIQGDSTADFQPVAAIENCGILSQESVVTYKDTVYFLWIDGVYQWNDNGLVCVSDAANVRSWFATDKYFNRGMFSQSFAVFDQVTQTYRLFLCSAGQVQTDRWVEFNLITGKFYGPHQTQAFAPSCALIVRGSNDQPYPMIGSREGFLSQDVATRADWQLTPIVEDVIMTPQAMGDPDVEKFFGEMSIHTQAERAGTLQISAIVGDLNETATVSLSHDLTVPRERLERLGEGKYLTLRFQNAQLGQQVVLHGYTIPTHVTGRR